MAKGRMHIYFGDGKGKTTAAVGLAVRCIGGGGRVLFAQFLKDGKSGEAECLKKIGADVVPCPENVKFTFMMTEDEKNKLTSYYNEGFEHIVKNAAVYDMIIFDEVLHAVMLGFLDEKKLSGFLASRPDGTEIVLTGAKPDDKILALADYVTEMKKIRHPYDKGLEARKFIEY